MPDAHSLPDRPPQNLESLAEIDARQDEVLRQLDELNERLERTLAQFASLAPATKQVDARREAA